MISMILIRHKKVVARDRAVLSGTKQDELLFARLQRAAHGRTASIEHGSSISFRHKKSHTLIVQLLI